MPPRRCRKWPHYFTRRMPQSDDTTHSLALPDGDVLLDENDDEELDDEELEESLWTSIACMPTNLTQLWLKKSARILQCQTDVWNWVTLPSWCSAMDILVNVLPKTMKNQKTDGAWNFAAIFSTKNGTAGDLSVTHTSVTTCECHVTTISLVATHQTFNTKINLWNHKSPCTL